MHKGTAVAALLILLPLLSYDLARRIATSLIWRVTTIDVTKMTQDEALQLLKLGNNVFLTGSAGSGKTYLLNRYIRYLRRHKVGVSVTASTGLAATHLNGRTIHSWSGIGVREAMSKTDLNKLQRDKRVRKRYRKTKVLIIDEVSMIHAYQLDLIDQVARHMLEPLLPFGGLQVVLCGDFFQLPPVASDSTPSRGFAFDSIAWDTAGFYTCYLHEQHRQGNDPLLNVLNDIRSGNTGEHTKVPLRTRYKKAPVGTVLPTKLFARNINVDSINHKALHDLKGTENLFNMKTQGSDPLVDALIRTCPAPSELKLKAEAKVMFVKNASDGSYVNGTLGSVKSFDSNGMPVVETFDGQVVVAEYDDWKYEEDDRVLATISQVPLKLAWAITVHKSQGMTLDAAEIDLSDAFEPGMGYVALSRVRALSGLNLLGLNETALSVHPQILQRDSEFQSQSDAAVQQLATLSDAERTRQQTDTMLDRFQGKCVTEKQPVHQASANNTTPVSTQPVASALKKAYQPWEDTDDKLLEALYNDNQSINTIARQLQRGHGAIRSRLKKLTLISPAETKNYPQTEKQTYTEHSLSTPLKETQNLLRQKKSIESIAALRGLAKDTVISHIESLQQKKHLPDISYLVKSIDNFEEIRQIFKQTDSRDLPPIREKMRGTTPYYILRLVRLISEIPNRPDNPD